MHVTLSVTGEKSKGRAVNRVQGFQDRKSNMPLDYISIIQDGQKNCSSNPPSTNHRKVVSVPIQKKQNKKTPNLLPQFTDKIIYMVIKI